MRKLSRLVRFVQTAMAILAPLLRARRGKRRRHHGPAYRPHGGYARRQDMLSQVVRLLIDRRRGYRR